MHQELRLTSHALGELAGSRRTLLYMQQRAAGGREMASCMVAILNV